MKPSSTRIAGRMDWPTAVHRFKPLTQGEAARQQKLAIVRGRRRPTVTQWQRLRAWARRRWQRWLPATQDDRDAAYFLLGEIWMGGILSGVWLLVRYL